MADFIDARPAICQLDEEKNKYNTQHIQYTFRFNISNDYAIWTKPVRNVI